MRVPLHFLAFCAVASVAPLPAQDRGPVELAIKWPVGTRYVYVMDIESETKIQPPGRAKTVTQKMLMSQEMAISVLRETGEGGRVIEQEFLSQKMEMKMGDQTIMAYDSKALAPEDANPAVAVLLKMIGKKLTLTLAPDGRVEKLEGFEELLGDGGGNPQMQAAMKGVFNEEQFKRFFDLANQLPREPVSIGDSWRTEMQVPLGPLGNLGVDLTSTLEAVDTREGHRVAIVGVEGTLASTGTAKGMPGGMELEIQSGRQSGRNQFDVGEGMLRESAIEQELSMKMRMPAPEETGGAAIEMAMEMAQDISMRLTETGKIGSSREP